MSTPTHDPAADTGPHHSFKVLHFIRPGGGATGWQQMASGFLSAMDAIRHIDHLAAGHQLDRQAAVDPATGLPPEVSAGAAPLVGTEDAQAAPGATDSADRGQPGVTGSPESLEGSQAPEEG